MIHSHATRSKHTSHNEFNDGSCLPSRFSSYCSTLDSFYVFAMVLSVNWDSRHTACSAFLTNYGFDHGKFLCKQKNMKVLMQINLIGTRIHHSNRTRIEQTQNCAFTHYTCRRWSIPCRIRIGMEVCYRLNHQIRCQPSLTGWSELWKSEFESIRHVLVLRFFWMRYSKFGLFIGN